MKTSSKKVVVEKLNKAENFVKKAIEKYNSFYEKDRLIGKIWEEVNKKLGQDKIGDTRHLPPEYTKAMAKFLNYGK